MSQIALAWLYYKGVSSPIIGSTKNEHVLDAVNALKIKLNKEDISYLEELYIIQLIVGAINKNPEENVVLLDVKKN